ncbi:hypothetical protein FOXYSP1_17962 [Fusarium oxysporum f. sp. phaseoli]
MPTAPCITGTNSRLAAMYLSRSESLKRLIKIGRIRKKMSNTQLNKSPTASSLALFHHKRAHILASVIYVYKDPVWKHEGEEKSVEVVEFDPALTADDYDLGELEMRGPQPPFKISRMAWDWWDPTTTATSQAQHMGWTSW